MRPGKENKMPQLYPDWNRRLATILFWIFTDVGIMILLWWFMPIKYFVLVLAIFSGLGSVVKRIHKKWNS